jgi:hypothetical protein
MQVTKLERERVAGDRRKGTAPIDTLNAIVEMTERFRRKRRRAEQREGAVKVH